MQYQSTSKKYQLSAETECCLEDLPRVMVDIDRWWKRVKEICVDNLDDDDMITYK